MSDFLHHDCMNYANIDVAKGMCLLSGQPVSFDGKSCPGFELKPKCKHCLSYTSLGEDGAGTCTGLEDGEFWTAGERTTTTCEGYRKK